MKETIWQRSVMAVDVCRHIQTTAKIPMSTVRTCRRTLIAAALAVAAIPSLAADRAVFSRTVFKCRAERRQTQHGVRQRGQRVLASAA